MSEAPPPLRLMGMWPNLFQDAHVEFVKSRGGDGNTGLDCCLMTVIKLQTDPSD